VDFAVIKYQGTDGSPMWTCQAAGDCGRKPGIRRYRPSLQWPGERRRSNLGHRHGSRWQSLRRRAQHGSQRRSVDFFTIKYFVRTDNPWCWERPLQRAGKRHRPGLRVRDMERPGLGRQYIFRTGHRRGLCFRDGKQHRPRNPAPQEYTTIVYDGALGLRWVQKYF